MLVIEMIVFQGIPAVSGSCASLIGLETLIFILYSGTLPMVVVRNEVRT